MTPLSVLSGPKTKNQIGHDLSLVAAEYPGKVATPTADMLVTKILLNSGISMCGAKFMTMDISNFYLNTSD